MPLRFRSLLLSAVATTLAVQPAFLAAQQAPVRLAIDAHTSVSPVSPTLYGLMTEEINYAYDGGLYAEMIRNRTAVHTWEGFSHWYLHQQGTGRASMAENKQNGPSKALPSSMLVKVTAASPGNEAGVVNEGYWGIAVRPSTTYTGSFYARPQGETSAHARLIDDNTGVVLAEARVPLNDGSGWQRYTYTMTTGARATTGSANHFILSFDRPGTVALQLVSLFPPTDSNRPNGNRADLMNMMRAMRPTFLRLPGGNYLEGDTFQERFNWKETVGPLVDRPTHRSPWNYQSTDGMGLLEFLEWCEDLKIEPVLAVFAGYSLKGEHVVGPALEPYVQEALEEIEYVTGDSSTKYGAMRARDGHPTPFPLHYIEIGNEDEFDKSKSYDARFAQFAKAIRAKYPQYKLIATTPIKQGNPDVIDDHYYKTPEEFFALVHKYDTADRNGPKIFVGEWATRVGSPTPNMAAALGDAAWMTGMERNSDLIVMASYAPLFVNVNPGGMQWSTDLIGYDASRVYGSPAYYAQVLFASHIGDHTVQSTVTGGNSASSGTTASAGTSGKTTAARTANKSATGSGSNTANNGTDSNSASGGPATAMTDGSLFFHSATVSADKRTLYLKLVNASDQPQPVTLAITGAKAGKAPMQTLSAATRWQTNTIDHPTNVVPVASTTTISTGETRHTIPANTIEVIDVPLQ